MEKERERDKRVKQERNKHGDFVNEQRCHVSRLEFLQT